MELLRAKPENPCANLTPREDVMFLTDEIKTTIRIPYVLRHLPETGVVSLLPTPSLPATGDVALAEVKQIGKNTALELNSGRRCALHPGDLDRKSVV